MSILDIVNGVFKLLGWSVVKKTCGHSKKLIPRWFVRIGLYFGDGLWLDFSSRDPRISLKFCIKSTGVVMALMPKYICYGYFLFDWFSASLLLKEISQVCSLLP